MKFTITGEESGIRLDRFVTGRVPSFSRSVLQKGIEDGHVLLNGNSVKKRVLLKAGDIVEVDDAGIGRMNSTAVIPQNIDLEIIYEDEYLLAVNKAAGIVVHPGSGNREGTVVNSLLYHVNTLSDGFAVDRPGIVHRLDKETSGVLLVTKTNSAHSALAALFEKREIQKIYVGFCVGARPLDHDIIRHPVGRSRANPVKQVVRTGGRTASTEYWLRSFRSGVSLLRFSLHTGRTHQIRVHCSHCGFPVVSDRVYGGGREKAETLQPMERPFAHQVLKCFSRQALHARQVKFRHPFTGKDVSVAAPFPEDFRKALELFGESAEFI